MAALLDEVGDSQSVRSSATSGTSRGKGPHEIDGRIFLRVKSCPCCGIKNTDLNLVQRGRYGPDFSKHTLWFRGTSENPDSRYCKLGVLTWQHGGFADQHETMDLYVAAMKKDVELQKQHEAAMKEMIAVVEEGRLRFKSGEKAKTSMRLQDARQSAVTSFKAAAGGGRQLPRHREEHVRGHESGPHRTQGHQDGEDLRRWEVAGRGAGAQPPPGPLRGECEVHHGLNGERSPR